MNKHIASATALTIAISAAPFVAASIPNYLDPVVYSRTGTSAFNLPDGSSSNSATIALNNDRDIVSKVNFVGGSGNTGLFYGEFSGGLPDGGIVFETEDFASDPTINSFGQTLFVVGPDAFVYDSATESTEAINLPIGATSSSNLNLVDSLHLAGRLRFGFSGNAYGAFPLQSSGLPNFTIYAADSDLDASSEFSFLFSPSISRTGVGSAGLPRIAAKVATAGGFDFEEIRIFDSDGSSTLVATEIESDADSPFSEFGVNSVAISDDGSKVAFEASDLNGVSGVYRYDDVTGAIDLIAATTSPMIREIDFFGPSINDQGLVVFRGDDDQGRSSVFIGDGSEIIRLAGEGDLIQTDLGIRQLGRRDMDFSQSGAPRINNNGDVGFMMQYFDPDDGSSVADGTLTMLHVAQSVDGDFNNDGVYDCADIDALTNEIVAATNSPMFDLSGDGVVDVADRELWLSEAGALELGAELSFLVGDANLDGFVDLSDFNEWNANKFTASSAWCKGDFNTDGAIDASDFNEWNVNKFQASAGLVVPEPSSHGALLIALTSLGLRVRKWFHL